MTHADDTPKRASMAFPRCWLMRQVFARRLTMTAFAELAQVAPGTLSRVNSGRPVTMATYARIMDALENTPEVFSEEHIALLQPAS